MRDGRHVILCVDDDPDILDTLRIIIEGNGYLFTGASSAEAGLRSFKQEKPDFIMVDLMMEEADSGTSLVKELKAAGNTAPVYMLSSIGDALNQSTDYSSLGLDGVFQKPVQPQVLLMTLKLKLKK